MTALIVAALPFVPWVIVLLWLISLGNRVSRLENSGKPKPTSDTYTRKRGAY